MSYVAKFWTWIKDNLPFILIVTIFGIYVWANAAALQTVAQLDKDELACKTLCFPQQSEYITHGTTSACWCYTNQNTMNKAE